MVCSQAREMYTSKRNQTKTKISCSETTGNINGVEKSF
jgi:hypothetical protein